MDFLALEVMASVCSEVVMYSDRSGLNGQIGAAVVLYRDSIEQGTFRKHLGSEEQHTMFEAEVLSLPLVIELIKMEAHVWSAVIRADSQDVILANRHTRGTPGQHLAGLLHEHMDAI